VQSVLKRVAIRPWRGFFFKKLWSEIDTLDKEVADHKRETLGYEYYERKVDSYPINEILKSYGPFDIVNIDIEGLDGMVVEAMDAAYAPSVILFENHDPKNLDRVDKKLRSNNFSFVFKAGPSYCYSKL
jgi:hypothetical protein